MMFRNYRDYSRAPVEVEKTDENICKRKRFKCDLCDDGWQSETDTFLHRENHADEMRKWFGKRNHNVCLTCVKRFPQKDALLRHIKVKHLYSTAISKRVERQIFVCDQCYHIFFNKTMLTAHIFKKHWNFQKDLMSKLMFPCPSCFKEQKLNQLWQHLQKHCSMSISLCKICYTKSKDSTELQTHLSAKHIGHFHCDQCSKTEHNASMFLEHVKLHEKQCSNFEFNWEAKETKKDYVTDVTNWQYPKLKALEGVNLHSQLYICILCRHICSDDVEMRNHAASHFMVLKPAQKSNQYKCICGETFTSNILRKQHLFKFKEGHGAAESCTAEKIEKTVGNEVAVTIERLTTPEKHETEKNKIMELVTGGLLDRIFIC